MNTLNSEQVSEVLLSLHEKSSADFRQRRTAAQLNPDAVISKTTAYMSVTPEEGAFLNFLARVAGSKNMVEFGCSFGISAIYLASAARDNGGHLITTELEPNKVIGARKNLIEAGLADLVTILEGDATETLKSVDGRVDLLFLDGAKEFYLPVFELLQYKLSDRAIICADNADKEGAQPFVQLILNAPEQYASSFLFDGRLLVATALQ